MSRPIASASSLTRSLVKIRVIRTDIAVIPADQPAEIGLKVCGVKDYLTDIPGFTKSNVLFYDLEGGCAVAVRPSGTEPKVKTYVMAKGESAEEAEANRAAIRSAVDKLLGA